MFEFFTAAIEAGAVNTILLTAVLVIILWEKYRKSLGLKNGNLLKRGNPGNHGPDPCAQLLTAFDADGVIGKIHGNTTVAARQVNDMHSTVNAIELKVDALAEMQEVVRRVSVTNDMVHRELEAHRGSMNQLTRAVNESIRNQAS